jgi:hypothetical protein
VIEEKHEQKLRKREIATVLERKSCSEEPKANFEATFELKELELDLK